MTTNISATQDKSSSVLGTPRISFPPSPAQIGAMNEYIALVNKLAHEDSDSLIQNSTTEHARVLVDKLFSTASNCAKVFTGGLNQDIYAYASVVSAVGKFLGNGGELRIVIQDPPAEGGVAAIVANPSGLFEKLRESNIPLDRVSVFLSGRVGKLLPFHFMVFDNKSYRFEPNKETHSAFAAFRGPAVAKPLSELFDALTSNAQVCAKTWLTPTAPLGHSSGVSTAVG